MSSVKGHCAWKKLHFKTAIQLKQIITLVFCACVCVCVCVRVRARKRGCVYLRDIVE